MAVVAPSPASTQPSSATTSTGRSSTGSLCTSKISVMPSGPSGLTDASPATAGRHLEQRPI